MKPSTRDAYQLFHEGALALAEVERAGFRVDVELLKQTTAQVDEDIAALTEEQKRDEVWRVWKRRFGDRASMGSRKQLATVLFDELGHKSNKRTEKGNVKVDEEVLGEIDLPFVKRFTRIEKLKKLKGTYLSGINSELTEEGYIHPSFNLHLVRTFRSSADSPNIQNQIRRDEEFAERLRRCFIPRDGHVLVEIDYSALEFRIASCFWADAAMVKYASDPTLDIHRDMAEELYLLPHGQVPKMARFYAKNQFVFPELYGSDYIACTRNLWNVIGTAGLTTADGVPLGEHLRGKGITVLGKLDRKRPPLNGSFEKHVLAVERRFNKRFPQWADRREQWWDRYQRQGWFRTATGFVCKGVYSRNELMNYPIQGPAFHCLLWSLTQMVKWIRRGKLRSRVVAQIHDSIIGDVHRDELDVFIQQAKQVMTVDVRKHWDWIIVPLDIEVEVGEQNWFEKKTVKV